MTSDYWIHTRILHITDNLCHFFQFDSVTTNNEYAIKHIGFMMKLDSKKHLRNVHHRRVYLISHEWFAVCGFIPNCPVAVFQRKITHTHYSKYAHAQSTDEF